MKKICCGLLCLLALACKKESALTPEENSTQKLIKIVKQLHLSNEVVPTETISFEYNSAGYVIAEGNKTYVRDGQQRIVRILDPGTSTNRDAIDVHYTDAKSTAVAYTISNFENGDQDSVVYSHNSSGQMVQTKSYFWSAQGGHWYESLFEIFGYDGNNNLVQIDTYNVSDGRTVHCGQYYFGDYDSKLNPQFAADEVRSVMVWFEGLSNCSKNNLRSIGNFTKTYEYRADGRPRSCTVQQNGVVVITLLFEYD